MILSSFAIRAIVGAGALNFFGEKQIQSQTPLTGYTPEVSMCVLMPASFRDLVRTVRSYISGSPPVITATGDPLCLTFSTIFVTGVNGWAVASQDSFTSHHTHPTSHP